MLMDSLSLFLLVYLLRVSNLCSGSTVSLWALLFFPGGLMMLVKKYEAVKLNFRFFIMPPSVLLMTRFCLNDG